MAIKNIRIMPDPQLVTPCHTVQTIDAPIQTIIQDLRDTLANCQNGIGLAAPQIGSNKRLFAIKINQEQQEITPPTIIINPIITAKSTITQTDTEGCLSLPDVFADITRPKTITLTYTDDHNTTVSLTAHDLLARCLQHEIDHLDGILFIDYLSPLKRRLALKKVTKRKNQS